MAEVTTEPNAEYAALLENALGLPGVDWWVDRWDEEYEGWHGSFVRACDEKGCYCCDPKNLTAADADLLLSLFPEARRPNDGSGP